LDCSPLSLDGPAGSLGPATGRGSARRALLDFNDLQGFANKILALA
jgi:hypothetical protein